MTAETSNARGLVAKLAAHVRPTCSELWDEAQAFLAAEGVQAGEVEQRARELLAAEYERDGFDPVQAEQIRDGYVNNTTATSLRAIVAALSQQPEAWGVVDVEAIRRACQSGKRFWQAGPGYYEEIESLLPALTEARNVR